MKLILEDVVFALAGLVEFCLIEEGSLAQSEHAPEGSVSGCVEQDLGPGYQRSLIDENGYRQDVARLVHSTSLRRLEDHHRNRDIPPRVPEPTCGEVARNHAEAVRARMTGQSSKADGVYQRSA